MRNERQFTSLVWLNIPCLDKVILQHLTRIGYRSLSRAYSALGQRDRVNFCVKTNIAARFLLTAMRAYANMCVNGGNWLCLEL